MAQAEPGDQEYKSVERESEQARGGGGGGRGGIEEDQKLAENVAKYGAKNWSQIAQALPGRIGK